MSEDGCDAVPWAAYLPGAIMTTFAIGEKALLVATLNDIAGGLLGRVVVAPCIGKTVTVAAGPHPHCARCRELVYEVTSEDGLVVMIVPPRFLQKLPPQAPKERERWTDTPGFKEMLGLMSDVTERVKEEVES